MHEKGSKENVCGSFNEIPGYQNMEAMLFALKKLNERSDVLPGIRLGALIYDTCRSPTISADKTKEFIKLTLPSPKPKGLNLAGVIGPYTSGNSVIVANFLRVFEIPQISYGSVSVQLSDKDIYSYFFRTIAPDSYFAEALAEFSESLGWNYVSIIYSKGVYSETGAHEVRKALAKRSICVAQNLRLPRFPEQIDYDEAIMEAASIQEANVLVLMTVDRDSRKLLTAKRRLPSARRLTIVGGWGNHGDVTEGLGHLADGTVTFGHQEGNITEFEEYFRSLNVSRHHANYKGWFEEFWQKRFDCCLKNAKHKPTENCSKYCTGEESLLDDHVKITYVRAVVNAVNAMAYALHNMQKSLCPNVTGLCQEMKPIPRTLLQKFLKNVTFPDSVFKWPIRFDKNNEIEGNYTVLNYQSSNGNVHRYVPVGTWTGKLQPNGKISGQFKTNFSTIRWFNGNVTPPSSVCSLVCDYRSIKLLRSGPARNCCWDCKACNKYDVIVNNTCQMCGEGFVPDSNLSRCSKLTLKYINLDTPFAIVLIFCSCLGFLAELAAITVFLANRQHPLIKASNSEMCYCIFFGICLVFMVPFLFLAKPTKELCFFQRFIMGVSFTICYAPLLLQVWRIHRIFKSGEDMRKLSQSTPISRRSQLLITIGLVIVQVLFSVLHFSKDPPDLKEKFYPDNEDFVLECPLTPSVFIVCLAYNVLLMFLCTVYAFLTRSFPKNFNEAMYIGVTMCLTWAVWVVFLACYMNVHDSFSRVYWISGTSVLIGWITLAGLFPAKIYHLYTKCVRSEYTCELE